MTSPFGFRCLQVFIVSSIVLVNSGCAVNTKRLTGNERIEGYSLSKTFLFLATPIATSPGLGGSYFVFSPGRFIPKSKTESTYIWKPEVGPRAVTAFGEIEHPADDFELVTDLNGNFQSFARAMTSPLAITPGSEKPRFRVVHRD